jgi:putative membrane protein
VPADSHAERERLLVMARKLYRFSGLLMVVAIALGLVLWLGYGVGKGPGNYWLHAKLVLVVGAIGYHHACRSLLRKFEEFANEAQRRWSASSTRARCSCSRRSSLVVVKPF